MRRTYRRRELDAENLPQLLPKYVRWHVVPLTKKEAESRRKDDDKTKRHIVAKRNIVKLAADPHRVEAIAGCSFCSLTGVAA